MAGIVDLRKDGRVLYVSSVDISLGNGPGVNELDFVLALHGALGERARFVLPRPAGEVSRLPLSACRFVSPHHKHNPFHYARHLVSLARAAQRELGAREYDLLVFRLDVMPIAQRLLVRKNDVPYAVKTLGLGELKALRERGGIVGAVLSAPNRRLISGLVSGSLVTDACSTGMVDYLNETLDLPSDRVVMIDNAVAMWRFAPRSREETRRNLGLGHFGPIIGYIGSRPLERGGRQLLEVAPRLARKHPKLGVVIVGNGRDAEGLKRLADSLSIRERCVFAGYVPFEEVPDYAYALDVGVSINVRSDRFAAAELKVRQYVAAGVPVVATGGSNEFLTTAGLGSIVSAEDTDAIEAELIRWLSLSPDERTAFSTRASEFARKNLSVEQALARRLDLWNSHLVRRATAAASA